MSDPIEGPTFWFLPTANLPEERPTLYKVLKEGGRAPFRDNYEWKLPTENPDGTWTPGEWMEAGGLIQPCSNGLHSFSGTQSKRWMEQGSQLYEIEYEGPVQLHAFNDPKWVGGKARLVRQIHVDYERIVQAYREVDDYRRRYAREAAASGASRAVEGEYRSRLAVAGLKAAIERGKPFIGDKKAKELVGALDDGHIELVKVQFAALAQEAYGAKAALATATSFLNGPVPSKKLIAHWNRIRKARAAMLVHLVSYVRGEWRISTDVYSLSRMVEAGSKKAKAGPAQQAFRDLLVERNTAAREAQKAAEAVWDDEHPIYKSKTFEEMLVEFASSSRTTGRGI